MLDKVPGLVEILGADGVMLDELHVVVLCDIALSVVPDPVHNRDAEVLDGSEEIFVSDEISPDCAAIGHLDVLTEIVQEHCVSQLVPVEDGVDVLLVLTDSLPEVFVTYLEPQLGFKHFFC